MIPDQKTTLIASWIRQQLQTIRLAGFAFYVLALGSAVFWLFGAEIEPLVFILGAVSSSLWGLPLLADYLSPERKRIGDMSDDEILTFVDRTHPKLDWDRIDKNMVEETYLKEDPKLRFILDFNHVQEQNFREEWANRHPDPNATGYWCDLEYNGSTIKRYLIVSIDGSRARIPAPDLTSKKIKRRDYHVGRIVERMNSIDEYIRRSRLEIEEE